MWASSVPSSSEFAIQLTSTTHKPKAKSQEPAADFSKTAKLSALRQC